MDCLCEEHSVESACAGPCNNVSQNAQPQTMPRLDLLQHKTIDILDALQLAIATADSLACASDFPDLLGYAVHIDRETYAAVANECNAEFLLAH
jgi:hypothetical protein